MNFTPIDNSNRVEGYCLIQTVERKSGKNGDYLDVVLTDSSGSVNAKLWRYSSIEHGEYSAGELVKIRGVIKEFNGSDQLNIERIRHITDSDEIKAEDFVRSADYTGEQMYNELMNIAGEFTNDNFRLLVTEILKDRRIALLYWPAAFKLHHAIRGGLLMHTLSVVRLAQKICEVYRFVDRELLLAGAILHDIAKIEEFAVSPLGTPEGYTVEGNLLGHIAMGTVTVAKYAERLGIDSETAMLIEHMILSHHGEPEFGAAVRPMFIEAELLSELDLMDARVYEMKEAVFAAKENDFSQRLWALDNRKLFHHKHGDLSAKTCLF